MNDKWENNNSNNKCNAEPISSVSNEINTFTWDLINNNSNHWKQLNVIYRDLYSFTSVIESFYKLQQLNNENENLEFLSKQSTTSIRTIETILIKLDYSLLFGGPLFYDLILKFIDSITVYINQSSYNESISSFNNNNNNSNDNNENNNKSFKLDKLIKDEYLIERVKLPSLQLFQSKYLNKEKPVIIEGGLSEWPASTLWKDFNYLKSVAGMRTVPIEIGDTYLQSDWTQKLMTLNQFIDNYILNSNNNNKREIGYLAQTRIFEQIPKLRKDIIIPDYCFLSSSTDDDFEEPIISIWFGPNGTTTPLHFDPYNNLLCQVFGSKYIRLYSKDQSDLLYPHSNDSLFSNTSKVDIESINEIEFPNFKKAEYIECILNEGDILYIPPGYWHYVHSLSNSFSISFWF